MLLLLLLLFAAASACRLLLLVLPLPLLRQLLGDLASAALSFGLALPLLLAVGCLPRTATLLSSPSLCCCRRCRMQPARVAFACICHRSVGVAKGWPGEKARG